MYGTIILKGGGKIENVISCEGYGNTALKVNILNEEPQIVYVTNIFTILF